VYIDVPAYPPPVPPVPTPPLLEWTSGLLPISPSPSVVPSPVSSPMISMTVLSLELSPALFERYARDIGELFTRSGAVKDGIFSQRYRFRSLEYEQERVAGENQDLRLQLAKERCAQLELAKVVDSMRRGQEPRGDA
ncbi:hypothetical protein Tco_0238817, partial [Tanacetum coccineum]